MESNREWLWDMIVSQLTRHEINNLSNQTKETRQGTKDKQLIINGLSFIKIKTIVYDYLFSTIMQFEYNT